MRLLPLPGVFQPRSDSHMLAERVREERLPPDARVLDLCTGSGLVAVTAARAHGAETTAIDISRRAVWAARLNGLLNGVRIRAVRGDMFAPLGPERFDLIASNPPYLPGPIERLPRTGPERHWEGGVHGRIFIDRICDEAPAHLRPGGSLLLLQSSVCDIPATLARLAERQLETEIVFTHRGPLGPILSARSDWLRRQGLLGDDAMEDVVIIRGRLPDPMARTSSGGRTAENGRTGRPDAMRAGTRSD